MDAALTERSAEARRHPSLFSVPALLAAPGILFLLLMLGYPLIEVLLRSLNDPSPDNYLVLGYAAYQKVMFNTFKTALLVTLCCLLLGYPYAYVLCRVRPRMAALLMLLVLFPFWSSILVRTYAWIVLLQDNGVINDALKALGLIEKPLRMIRTGFAATLGMVHVMLPFMVLSLYAVMRRIDRELGNAAAGLGAPPFRAFVRVFLPLSLRGVFAGSLLVFTMSLGFYITPALLGGPRDVMIGEVIADRVNGSLLQFGVGSAISIVLLALTLAILWLGTRLVGTAALLGQEE